MSSFISPCHPIFGIFALNVTFFLFLPCFVAISTKILWTFCVWHINGQTGTFRQQVGDSMFIWLLLYITATLIPNHFFFSYVLSLRLYWYVCCGDAMAQAFCCYYIKLLAGVATFKLFLHFLSYSLLTFRHVSHYYSLFWRVYGCLFYYSSLIYSLDLLSIYGRRELGVGKRCDILYYWLAGGVSAGLRLSDCSILLSLVPIHYDDNICMHMSWLLWPLTQAF